MMPYFENDKRIHDVVVVQLAKQIRQKYPDHKLSINPKFKRQGGGPKLNNPYYADLVDETAKIVYEVHWKGERKEASFYNLPDPWKGVNVFIEDRDTPFTIVVKVPDVEFALIERSRFSKIL
jgi:hypothetical protein